MTCPRQVETLAVHLLEAGAEPGSCLLVSGLSPLVAVVVWTGTQLVAVSQYLEPEELLDLLALSLTGGHRWVCATSQSQLLKLERQLLNLPGSSMSFGSVTHPPPSQIRDFVIEILFIILRRFCYFFGRDT